jgi:hypothetical protein
MSKGVMSRGITQILFKLFKKFHIHFKLFELLKSSFRKGQGMYT